MRGSVGEFKHYNLVAYLDVRVSRLSFTSHPFDMRPSQTMGTGGRLLQTRCTYQVNIDRCNDEVKYL